VSANVNPVVSIIVPARNEEACLGACLDSLVTQTGISFQLIVVDDASTDRTPQIARSFTGVTVISAPPLPENWTGKNNAMSAGAKVAKGKWLLFTDADTIHKAGSLARAVTEAEQHGAALLSYSPEQEVRTFWEKAVMPVIFAELAAAYPPKKVSDAAFPIAAANGQYLMISREAYDAVGGHTMIANDLLEDVAMARLVKSSGRRIFFRYGGDAVRTRMYRSWAQMKEGWTKNLALLFPKPTEVAQQRLGDFVLPPLGLYMVIASIFWPPNPVAWLRWSMLISGAWVVAAPVAGFVRRSRRAHFPCSNIAHAYLGLPVFAYFLVRSKRSLKRARFAWKDRTYVYSDQEMEALRNERTARST
jgi:Glycosyl transferase family 2